MQEAGHRNTVIHCFDGSFGLQVQVHEVQEIDVADVGLAADRVGVKRHGVDAFDGARVADFLQEYLVFVRPFIGW